MRSVQVVRLDGPVRRRGGRGRRADRRRGRGAGRGARARGQLAGPAAEPRGVPDQARAALPARRRLRRRGAPRRPPASGLAVGDRVACCLPYGGGADLVAVPADSVFPLPDAIGFEKAAALPMNYLTAQFALETRGRPARARRSWCTARPAGSAPPASRWPTGTAPGPSPWCPRRRRRTSSRGLGADHAVLVDGFLAAVKELTDGRGRRRRRRRGRRRPDDRLAARARARWAGCWSSGSPPAGSRRCEVNRLLLNNIDVRGVGWGAYAMARPGFMRGQWDALLPMIEPGWWTRRSRRRTPWSRWPGRSGPRPAQGAGQDRAHPREVGVLRVPLDVDRTNGHCGTTRSPRRGRRPAPRDQRGAHPSALEGVVDDRVREHDAVG